MRIDVDIQGRDEVRASLEVFAELLRDWRPAWQNISRDFMRIEAEWFASDGDGSWAPWREAYTRWEDPSSGHGFDSSGLLRASGGLERSLTTDETILHESMRELTLGTDYHAESNVGSSEPVAEILDSGFIPRGRMSVVGDDGATHRVRVGHPVPPRKLLGVHEDDKARWVEVFVNDWVWESARKAGL